MKSEPAAAKPPQFEIASVVQIRLHLPTDVVVAFSKWADDHDIISERAGGSAPDPERIGWAFATRYFPAKHEAEIRRWLSRHTSRDQPARRKTGATPRNKAR